jgi:hypothetical protein
MSDEKSEAQAIRLARFEAFGEAIDCVRAEASFRRGDGVAASTCIARIEELRSAAKPPERVSSNVPPLPIGEPDPGDDCPHHAFLVCACCRRWRHAAIVARRGSGSAQTDRSDLEAEVCSLRADLDAQATVIAQLREEAEGRAPLYPAELLQRGGEWLGAARNWLKWHTLNGERVTWGSGDLVEPQLSVRQIEDLAAEVAAAAMRPQPTEESLSRALKARWTAEAELDRLRSSAAPLTCDPDCSHCREVRAEALRCAREDEPRPGGGSRATMPGDMCGYGRCMKPRLPGRAHCSDACFQATLNSDRARDIIEREAKTSGGNASTGQEPGELPSSSTPAGGPEEAGILSTGGTTPAEAASARKAGAACPCTWGEMGEIAAVSPRCPTHGAGPSSGAERRLSLSEKAAGWLDERGYNYDDRVSLAALLAEVRREAVEAAAEPLRFLLGHHAEHGDPVIPFASVDEVLDDICALSPVPSESKAET